MFIPGFEAQLVGVLGRQAEDRVLGAEQQRRVVVLAGRHLVEQSQQGAVHQSELVQVSPGHHQLVADAQAPTPHRLAIGVERGAQGLIDRVDPQLPAVDGGEHLDVADRVDLVMGGQALGDERHELVKGGSRGAALDQKQVTAHALAGDE